MKRTWKTMLIIAVFLLLAMGMTYAWSAPQDEKLPTFSAKDREEINNYYLHLFGTLAPGSLDRSSFPLSIEKALVVGSHVPKQLEKEMEPLPGKLEAKLTLLTGAFRRYRLEHHVVLVRSADLTIADIMKNVAVK